MTPIERLLAWIKTQPEDVKQFMVAVANRAEVGSRKSKHHEKFARIRIKVINTPSKEFTDKHFKKESVGEA